MKKKEREEAALALDWLETHIRGTEGDSVDVCRHIRDGAGALRDLNERDEKDERLIEWAEKWRAYIQPKTEVEKMAISIFKYVLLALQEGSYVMPPEERT